MHRHLPNYTQSSIGNARRLRREMTDAERKLWSKLRANQLGVKFRRQVPFGRYILDFFCVKANLCIELDGSQHYTDAGRRKDEERDEYLRAQGVEVLRFTNIEALRNTDDVVQTIYDKVHERGNARQRAASRVIIREFVSLRYLSTAKGTSKQNQ